MATKSKYSRSTRWIFTLNNYKAEDETYFQNLPCKYLVYGREVAPTTGTLHLQGFIIFETKKSFSHMKELHGKASWRQVYGTTKRNIEYCKKDGNFFEKGDDPSEQRSENIKKGVGDFWETVHLAAKEGRFEDIPSGAYIRYHSNLHKIHAEHQQSKAIIPEAECTGVLIYGPSGVGKSWFARQEYPDAYIKNANKWWCGYRDNDYVILDDLSPSLAKALSQHLKIWTDHYPFTAETKGSSLFIRPKKVVITSQYKLEELFEDQATLEAMKRRCKCIHIGQPIHPYKNNKIKSPFP